ncbi:MULTISPECIES: hypothetical protein [Microbacterium]|uniref:hypothetical protein n=1 Tax=Microbacterium TaxID=33882 RepID=UPI00217D9AAF|nr:MULTISPECIES: hypothetical protein [Microbacterium]UWF77426.1 hypothetical protein JSY13_11790 [Microbacterium neungamense]WCM55588.1 hypothetical protein JRG78_11800 [Microbacterium sp. EF45047]
MAVTEARTAGRRATRAREVRRAGRDRYDKREAIAGYLFIAPWLIGFLVFTAGAMIYSL